MGINVLSLFDGMSCGQIALERLGIKVDNYFASEIDKYAIKITQKNYPNTMQLGDVNNWIDWNLPKIDLLIGGSPCQGFSYSGKGLNFNDPRSELFFRFVDCLRWYKPTYFLLENVRMKKKEWQDVISEHLNIEPIMIDSALVSAQMRKRLYWTNILDISQPKDKGILLKDILEQDAHLPVIHNIYGGFKETKVREFYEKSPTIRTPAGGGHIPSVYVDRDKSYCIDANYYKGTNEQQYKKKSRRQIVYINDKEYRLLTTLECERLQTVPEGYTKGVSNTQRYKMLGNGWTVDVIAHILSFIDWEI